MGVEGYCQEAWLAWSTQQEQPLALKTMRRESASPHLSSTANHDISTPEFAYTYAHTSIYLQRIAYSLFLFVMNM